MDTFFWDRELAALGDLDSLLGLVSGRSLDILDLLHHIVPLQHLAEDDVTAVEPPVCTPLARRRHPTDGAVTWKCNLRGDNRGDEELRAVGVLPGVGHGQEALLGVLELKVLVGELLAIDCN